MSRTSEQWEPSCSMRTGGQTYREIDGRTDMMKLKFIFRNFGNATIMHIIIQAILIPRKFK